MNTSISRFLWVFNVVILIFKNMALSRFFVFFHISIYISNIWDNKSTAT